MARSPAAAAVLVDRFFELSMVGLVASGYLAVLGSAYLDTPAAMVVASVLLLRALLATEVLRFRLPSLAIHLLTVACVAFFVVDLLTLSRELLPAAVHFVLFLAAIRILTARSTRDYIFVAAIAFLELLLASLISASSSFFLFLTLFLVFGVAAFAASEVRRSIRKPGQLARGGLGRLPLRLSALTLTIALGILALTGGLFFLLPRTAQMAFRHLAPNRFRVTGFSAGMTLGEVGKIRQIRTPVMHVRFPGGERPAGLKWRGAALTNFDGRRWFNNSEEGHRIRGVDGLITLGERSRAPGIGYEVQLSPMVSDALFFAGRPVRMRVNASEVVRTATNSYRIDRAEQEGLHYGVYSELENDALTPGAPPLSPEERIAHLALPPLDARLATLTRQVTADYTTDEARAGAIETYLRTRYGYSLEPLDRESNDPLATFLFERHEGYCEYFASAMAVMLRVIHIPSRVATGFQSGGYNPVSGWMVVRASDAHSWVEAWLPGRGWTTYDPTPPDPSPHSSPLWARLGFYLDAADTFWQEWVLNYDLDRQLTLAAQMEDSSRTIGSRWLDRARAAAARWKVALVSWGVRYGAVVLGLALVVWLAYRYLPMLWNYWKTVERVHQVRKGAALASDASLLYSRMLSLLRRRGFEKPAWVTPAEFARQLPPSETAVLVASFTAAYNDLRFGGNRDAARNMMQLLEAMRH